MLNLKKKKKLGKPEARWLLTYSDLMTAMFAFFVMIFALSDVDEGLFNELAIAAAWASPASPFDFGAQGINHLLGNGIMELPSIDNSIFEAPMPGAHGQGGPSQMEVAVDVLQTYFAELVAMGILSEDTITVEYEGEGILLIATHGDVYFDSGRANIRPETFPILEAIGSAIDFLGDVFVSVEGHTDDAPIATAQFPNNWWLSTARATNVLEHFVYTLGVISPDRIEAIGRGEYRPIDTNATPEGRQNNRRVEIRLFE